MMSKKILIILLLPIWVFAQNDTIKSNNNWTNSEVSFENKRIKKTRPILAKKDNKINKKVLISGRSIFNYSNTFKVYSGDGYASPGAESNLALTASVGGFLTRNFVLGVSLSYQSASTTLTSNEALAIGPFIRGYVNDFYSQVGYAISKGSNVFSAGFGYQVFLNKSKSVSLNPTILYSFRTYQDYIIMDGSGGYYNIGDITQEGILIGCAFEIHL